MMPSRPLFTILIIGVVIGLACDAEAQFSCPEASTEEQATRLAGETFDEGEQIFTEGLYRNAIERFECSYALRRHPNTLFNIARAAEELDDWALARSTYRNLIDRFPESEGVTEAEERLQVVEARLEEESDQDSSTNQENAPPDDQGVDDRPLDVPQEEPLNRMSGPRIGAWASFGLGLALTITGAALYGTAWSIHNGIPETVESGQDPSQYQSDLDRGGAFEGAGWALLGTGLASLVVSVVLFTAFGGRVSSSSRSRAPTLALLSPGGMYLIF